MEIVAVVVADGVTAVGGGGNLGTGAGAVAAVAAAACSDAKIMAKVSCSLALSWLAMRVAVAKSRPMSGSNRFSSSKWGSVRITPSLVGQRCPWSLTKKRCTEALAVPCQRVTSR